MKYDKDTDKSIVIHPELVKCREINDFHHANDAYLNIVVGNVYDVKFTQNPYNYIKEFKNQKDSTDSNEREKYHMDKIFNFNVKRGNEVAWVRNGENKSLDTVLKVMRKNTPIVTRMSYEAHGTISNQTIWSAEKAKNGVGYISTKTTDSKLDPNRYGGYSTLSTAYFFLVEHTKKGKRIRTIEAMPIYLKDKLDSKEKIEEWCADKEKGLGLEDPSVRLEKIKVYSRIRIDGFDLCLTGKQGNALMTCNEVQLIIDPFWKFYIKKLNGYSDKSENIINIKDNIMLYDIIMKKNIDGIFAKRINPLGAIIENGRSIFINSKMEDQVTILLNLLKIFSFENQGIDVKALGGAKQSGKMVPNKNISERFSVELINQSITGLYESKIDLLTV